MYLDNKTPAEKFELLREHYHFFTYENFHCSYTEQGLDIRFEFNIDEQIFFNPTLSIPFNQRFNKINKPSLELLSPIIFNMGLVELISYWKCVCPKTIIVKPFSLSQEQQIFWRKIYFNGLGEFFYTNHIQTTINDFFTFSFPTDQVFQPVFIEKSSDEMIPVGGGKDSVVTLELIKQLHKNTIPLIINPRGASLQSALAGGFKEDEIIKINRNIDPTLLDLNKQGFLNGHTPFSAMLAFTGILAGVCNSISNMALSNEASANEATVIGTNINHQYSKSFEFEEDFRVYVNKFLCPNFNYYSLLRPLNELQIAALFSMETKYNRVFKSCNVGSKTDSWCCNCSKCLFTFIMLAPFIAMDEMIAIYGENLFEKESLFPVLKELCGLTDEKPFECVGTIDEVNIALSYKLKSYGNKKLPILLKKYSELPVYQQYKNIPIQNTLNSFNLEHNLDENTFNIISKRLEWISSTH